MQILIVHQNFPGQFPHIADALVARGDRVVALGGPTARARPGVELRQWTNARASTRGLFPAATRAEADLIRAAAAAEAAVALRDAGFRPDVIVGHPGWGETLHLRDIFPDARQILFGEFYYRTDGADVGFDPEYETRDLAMAMRTNGKNATQALALIEADRIVCPTGFQASLMPELLRPRITVLHEGVDLARIAHRPDAVLTLPDGRTLDRSRPVVTFVSRIFERLRGFHIVMRAMPRIMAAVPDAEIVLIGAATGRPYGGSRPDGLDWKAAMLAELGDRVDPARLHFLGQVPHDQMIDALSVGRAHIYYTYPFVLSWSLVEAMACECAIAASDTLPVRDAIDDGRTGILNDFFDVDALAETVIAMLRQPERFDAMRHAARATALARFDRDTIGVPGWLRLIDETAA